MRLSLNITLNKICVHYKIHKGKDNLSLFEAFTKFVDSEIFMIVLYKQLPHTVTVYS